MASIESSSSTPEDSLDGTCPSPALPEAKAIEPDNVNAKQTGESGTNMGFSNTLDW